jgi:hypothetical protein
MPEELACACLCISLSKQQQQHHVSDIAVPDSSTVSITGESSTSGGFDASSFGGGSVGSSSSGGGGGGSSRTSSISNSGGSSSLAKDRILQDVQNNYDSRWAKECPWRLFGVKDEGVLRSIEAILEIQRT